MAEPMPSMSQAPTIHRSLALFIGDLPGIREQPPPASRPPGPKPDHRAGDRPDGKMGSDPGPTLGCGFGGLRSGQAALFQEHDGQGEELLPVVAGDDGLGLGIVIGIVQAHGGRIWVESAAGAGSRFSLTLPKSSAGSLSDVRVI